ncbi:MAG: ABC transporter permease [Pseudobdellovibrionaceae bacterium]
MGRLIKLALIRGGQFLISFLTLLLLTFTLLKFFPGSPLNDDRNLDPQVFQSLQEFYGLNKGLPEQLSVYLHRVFSGDLGASMHYVGRSVNSLIFEFGRTSMSLGLVAFALALIGAFLFSISSRYWPKCKDKADFSLLVLMSVPSLALGPLCIWFFGFYLQLLPVALLETPSSYLLPLFILSLKPMISLSRVLSSSLDLSLQEKYIQTARAMGYSEWRILSRFAMRNSLTSFLSQAAPLFASLISGSFLVEVLFAIPGLGYHFIESVLNRDWPMILGLTLVYGGVLMLSQLLADLLILIADPRVQDL